MKRFLLCMQSELRLTLTNLPVHLVGIFQPLIMFVLMSLVFVHPTFEMYVDTADPNLDELRAAMAEVGTPAGLSYIEVLPWDGERGEVRTQAVLYEERDGEPVYVQVYGLIDSNLVKNFRNRLTAAAFQLWNKGLGESAVSIEEKTLLPMERPFILFFGIAMLPMNVFMAAAIVGAMLMAQEFEGQTILEYRLAPVSGVFILFCKLLRLVLVAYLGALVLLTGIGLTTGIWPVGVGRLLLALLPSALIGASLGMLAGLLMKRTLPAFVICLILTLGTWILGSSFGLSVGFGGAYEVLSRFVPNTYVVELLFPVYYFGMPVGKPLVSALVLLGMCLLALGAMGLLYRKRMRAQG